MSKAAALGYALLCVGLAVSCYVIHLSICGSSFLFIALPLGGLWLYKFTRDRSIIRNARIEAAREPAQLAPSMTSPGSERLFVPPPLDRRS